MTRVTVDENPFSEAIDNWQLRGIWPARWIRNSCAHSDDPSVVAYCLRFSCDAEATFRIHVSADERYELFLDGRRAGRGPDRGDRNNWFFDTYDIELPPGEHVISTRVWWLGSLAPYAQISVCQGFLLAGEGAWQDRLSTGTAPWLCKKIGGYSFCPTDLTDRVGPSLDVDGSDFAWGYEIGEGADWIPPEDAGLAGNPVSIAEWHGNRFLCPSALPAMIEQTIHPGTARFVNAISASDAAAAPIASAECLHEELGPWNRLLLGRDALTVPGHTMRRVIVDLGQYFCAYPEITVSGGIGSSIRIDWAESLFEVPAGSNGRPAGHGNRDDVDGKYFRGKGDVFRPDGGTSRRFDTLWWQAGRYLQFLIATNDEAVILERFALRETRYPLEDGGCFDCSDHRLAQVRPLALRALQMCSHETYMDCPYLEQLMYFGDTRLQILTTYIVTLDDRLPRKALMMADQSRQGPSLTQSRYPSRIQSTIPPFSLWWIGMVHDYAMWRGDREFVCSLLPGVRSVIDAFRGWLNSDGLLEAVPHWNFTDWASDWWPDGEPPGARGGVSGLLNWQFVLVLGLAAELEEYAGGPEYAEIYRRLAQTVGQAVQNSFWDERRGIYADDLGKQSFSEHCQCLALLSGRLTDDARGRLAHALISDQGLTRTTVYFAHYLFEAYRLIGRTDFLISRLAPWFEWTELGLKTTPEGAPTSLSDCHAWGAHPIYHYAASILGVRPASFGFSRVRMTPQLGPLTWARGSVAHPRGLISAEFRVSGRGITGSVFLPDGVEGEICMGGTASCLLPGHQDVRGEL